MATLVRIAAHLRANLASHVALKLIDRRRLRSAHDVECDGLIGIATKTSDFTVKVTREPPISIRPIGDVHRLLRVCQLLASGLVGGRAESHS